MKIDIRRNFIMKQIMSSKFFSNVNLRTSPGPVLSLFVTKDRGTGPSIKARTLATLRVTAIVVMMAC